MRVGKLKNLLIPKPQVLSAAAFAVLRGYGDQTLCSSAQPSQADVAVLFCATVTLGTPSLK